MTGAMDRNSRPAASIRPLRRARRFVFASLFALGVAAPPAWAAEKPDCTAAGIALWGDGRHDDTKALNAWFKGEEVVWAESGRPVGAEIVGRVFLLSSTVYMPSGTGRRIERFQMIWPARHERVSGGAILTGDDPDKPATTIGIVTTGAGPDEGVPYRAPVPKPASRESQANCLVS
jgi:hypothetical protein